MSTFSGSGKSLTASSVSEVHQLRQAVRRLQRDAKEQLALEYESQATFEYLNTQVQNIRQAFTTLSDVVVEEVDTMREETARRVRTLEERLDAHFGAFKEMRQDVDLVKRTLDVWAVKERDWAKDTDMLKVGHAKTASGSCSRMYRACAMLLASCARSISQKLGRFLPLQHPCAPSGRSRWRTSIKKC